MTVRLKSKREKKVRVDIPYLHRLKFEKTGLLLGPGRHASRSPYYSTYILAKGHPLPVLTYDAQLSVSLAVNALDKAPQTKPLIGV